jgi:Uma2 family endonuclease
MSTLSTVEEIKSKKPSVKPRRVSKERFLREYTNREDGYKYEWNDGVIEKYAGMNQEQSKFYYLLLGLFLNTAAAKIGGMLIAETDMGTSTEQIRRPDIAYYTKEQLPMMWSGQNQVAPWVIEVISTNDYANKINKKLDEYFLAGVQVVWHIYPESKQVHVFTSPEQVSICRGNAVCSAAPALADLEVSAEELFV